MKKPYISVVIPVYNEQENLETLFSRLTAVMDKVGKPFEILFTNDGSRDQSGVILKEFHDRRPNQVRVIDFNGNFGQHMAIMAAFERVRGDVIVTLTPTFRTRPRRFPNYWQPLKTGMMWWELIEKPAGHLLQKIRFAHYQWHPCKNYQYTHARSGVHASSIPEEHS